MKIDAKSDYHGAALVKVRDMLRKHADGFSRKSFQRTVGGSQESVNIILEALVRDGFVTRDRIDADEFQLTARGQHLAAATAARKVKRATAVKALVGLMGRVEEINRDSAYLFRVTDVKVFGDYLGDAANLSDVDLCVNLLPKYPGHEFEKGARDQVVADRAKGQRFPGIREQVAWPKRKILNYLRGKEGLSLIHI